MAQRFRSEAQEVLLALPGDLLHASRTQAEPGLAFLAAERRSTPIGGIRAATGNSE